MVINKTVSKIYKLVEVIFAGTFFVKLLFVEVLFVGTVLVVTALVSSIISSHLIIEPSIIIPKYLPFSQLYLLFSHSCRHLSLFQLHILLSNLHLHLHDICLVNLFDSFYSFSYSF